MERPYVILNLAQSLNGYISGPDGRRVLLSSDEDWNRVMGMRRSVDGILIGKNTVIHDDPELKLNDDSPAIRIVIDPKLSLEGKNYRITDGTRRTAILNETREDTDGINSYIRCGRPFDLRTAMARLYGIGIRKILVEGGKITAENFLRVGMVDEMYVFISNTVLPDGGVRMPSVSSERRNAVVGITVISGGVLMKISPGEWI